MPPDTSTRWPVIQPLPGCSSAAMAPPMSSGRPTRPSAVCDAMSSAPGLVRYAARYTRSLQDAEDAYQRAMEIALTRAPTVEPQRFMAWLRTVVRNEADLVASAPGAVKVSV